MSRNQLIAVLLLITSPTCGACVQFKQQQWTTLKQQLQSGMGDKIVVEELDMTENVTKNILSKDPNYHRNLINFIPHTPEFLLVPVDIWKNKRATLKAVAFNSIMVGDKLVTDRQNTKSYAGYNIFFWIQETLKNHPLFQEEEDDLIYIPVDVIPNLDKNYYDDISENKRNDQEMAQESNPTEKKSKLRFTRNKNIDKFDGW